MAASCHKSHRHPSLRSASRHTDEGGARPTSAAFCSSVGIMAYASAVTTNKKLTTNKRR